jgi:hypothetical protein
MLSDRLIHLLNSRHLKPESKNVSKNLQRGFSLERGVVSLVGGETNDETNTLFDIRRDVCVRCELR